MLLFCAACVTQAVSLRANQQFALQRQQQGTSTSHPLSKRPAFVANVQYSRETMLTIRDLGKTYSSGIQALKGISLNVPPGMFGLLGPNGAGKTTLMKILATLLEADAGT